MMYPFLTLDDSTEIVHSEMQPDSTVKKTVFIMLPASFPATNGRKFSDFQKQIWSVMKRSFVPTSTQ